MGDQYMMSKLLILMEKLYHFRGRTKESGNEA